jgi:hypothetical protein
MEYHSNPSSPNNADGYTAGETQNTGRETSLNGNGQTQSMNPMQGPPPGLYQGYDNPHSLSLQNQPHIGVGAYGQHANFINGGMMGNSASSGLGVYQQSSHGVYAQSSNANVSNAPPFYRTTSLRQTIKDEMDDRERKRRARGHEITDKWLEEQEKIVTQIVRDEAVFEERANNLRHADNALAGLQNSLTGFQNTFWHVQTQTTMRHQVAGTIGHSHMSTQPNIGFGHVSQQQVLPAGNMSQHHHYQQHHHRNTGLVPPNYASMESSPVPPPMAGRQSFSDFKTPGGKRNRFEQVEGTPLDSMGQAPSPSQTVQRHPSSAMEYRQQPGVSAEQERSESRNESFDSGAIAGLQRSNASGTDFPNDTAGDSKPPARSFATRAASLPTGLDDSTIASSRPVASSASANKETPQNNKRSRPPTWNDPNSQSVPQSALKLSLDDCKKRAKRSIQFEQDTENGATSGSLPPLSSKARWGGSDINGSESNSTPADTNDEMKPSLLFPPSAKKMQAKRQEQADIASPNSTTEDSGKEECLEAPPQFVVTFSLGPNVDVTVSLPSNIRIKPTGPEGKRGYLESFCMLPDGTLIGAVQGDKWDYWTILARIEDGSVIVGPFAPEGIGASSTRGDILSFHSINHLFGVVMKREVRIFKYDVGRFTLGSRIPMERGVESTLSPEGRLVSFSLNDIFMLDRQDRKIKIWQPEAEPLTHQNSVSRTVAVDERAELIGGGLFHESILANTRDGKRRIFYLKEEKDEQQNGIFKLCEVRQNIGGGFGTLFLH